MIWLFYLGPRMCLGEQLTRMELFLLVANMLQRYRISFPDDYNPKDDSEVITAGAVRLCVEYKALFVQR